MTLRYNPFRPNGIVPPHMFCGREKEMQTVRQSLFQTKNENPQHFLIEGERGIGKSSLLHYIQQEAGMGGSQAVSLEFQFLVISIELNETMPYGSILHAIASEFRTQLYAHKDVVAIAATIWDFLTNWKVLGVEYKKGQISEIESDVLDDLARSMAKFTSEASNKASAQKRIDGILILIDEADKPSENARLGEFVKLFTERLTKIGCGRVCVGLSGLPALVGKLRASHESSLRVFETIPVGVISQDACEQVVIRALIEAKQKNGRDTTVDASALDLLGLLSEGYPHFVQQFGFSAFMQDDDWNISDNDVTTGAFSHNGGLDQLAKRYFHDLYYEQIWSPDYRKVLHTMTEHLDDWVSRSEILATSGVKSSQVTNALHTLKEKGIILVNPQKKAEYRLPSKSFAVWLKVLERRSETNVPSSAET